MRISRFCIENFRSIQHLDIAPSPFLCAVGHNNAGKSSLLIAMSLFVNGSRLRSSDFYDSSKDVVLTATLRGIDAAALSRLAETHADRVRQLVVNGSLTLVRRYKPGGQSTLRCHRLLPRDSRFHEENLSTVVKGSGKVLRESVESAFPELVEQIGAGAIKTQKDFKELIDELAAGIPPNELEFFEEDLPTGFENSVRAILPEVVYIPAVKDAADEVKTKEASSFGKILGILIELIDDSEELQNIKDSFNELHSLLNRQRTDDGDLLDERIEQIQQIESKVDDYVKEQFRNVSIEIEIPPPDLKSVFGNARIFVDDGIKGEVETKGDGLKRSLTFALLRTFVDLRTRQREDGSDDDIAGRYLFLFEEPELYLHPKAQRILFSALVDISTEHQVCVSTHSPFFFSPHASGTFLRLKKEPNAGDDSSAPITSALAINLLDELSKRDAYQIICYENNAAAFFSDRVVLVEGDSDLVFLKHAARVMDTEWDFDKRNVAIVRIGGKGNFARYREFFEAFEVDVRIIADLDVIIDDFAKLGASESCERLRSTLIQDVDRLIGQDDSEVQVKSSALKKAVAKSTFREKYEQFKSVAVKVQAGAAVSPDELAVFDELFQDEMNMVRRKVLETADAVAKVKHQLLAELRSQGINVLSQGAIEDYYPNGVTGSEKTSRALKACELVGDRESAIACCPEVVHDGKTKRPELEVIFENLFDGLTSSHH